MGKANYKDNVSMVQDTQKRSLTQNFSVLCLISDHIFFLWSSTKDILIWRPPSLSELNPIIFNIELTHLGSEVSI